MSNCVYCLTFLWAIVILCTTGNIWIVKYFTGDANLFHVFDFMLPSLYHAEESDNFYFLSSKTPSNSHHMLYIFPCIRCISCRTLWLSHHHNFYTIPKTLLESAWTLFCTVLSYRYFALHSFNIMPLLWQLLFLTLCGFLCPRILLYACTYPITAFWKMLMKNNHANIVSSTYVKLASNRLPIFPFDSFNLIWFSQVLPC